MATKKSKSKELALPGMTGSQSKALVNWRDRAKASIARESAVAAQLPSTGVPFISWRGGETTFNGEPLPNPTPVIVLATVAERVYYPGAFNPDAGASPACYSFGDGVPHPQAGAPQAERCKLCEWDQYTSANNKKGKACKEGARLAVISAAALKNPELLDEAPILQTRFGVTCAKDFWGPFQQGLKEQDPEAAIWQYVIEIKNKGHAKTQYELNFRLVARVTDERVLSALAARIDTAESLITRPYPTGGSPPAQEQKTKPAGGLARKF